MLAILPADSRARHFGIDGGAAEGSAWDDEAEILAFGELGGAFRAMCKRLPLLDGRGTFGASNPPLALMNDDRLK